MRPTARLPLLVALLHLPAACGSAPPPPDALDGLSGPNGGPIVVVDDHAILDAKSRRAIELGELVDRLVDADVVFLGEEHDNDVGHRLQAAITEALVARRDGVVISMEMFERDVQGVVDRYLAGAIDEETFRKEARPWPNYARHYRPAVELAKQEGLPLVAANVPRPLAARVVREGPRAVLAARHAPRFVSTAPGAYRARFDAAMGGHGGIEGVDPDHVFAAQCLKDDAMAQSIADALAQRPDALVVHWCGKFHSDAHLGTVERLRLRRPDLAVVVVTMASGGDLDRPLSDEERADGDFVLRVPAQPE